MVRRGDMLSLEDVLEILASDILGIIPDDESVVVSTNKGDPAVTSGSSRAGQAYRNITQRILGNDVPLMSLEYTKGFLSRFKRLLRVGRM